MANILVSKYGTTGNLSSQFARSGEPIRILVDIADTIVKNGGTAINSGDTIEVVGIPTDVKIIFHRCYFLTALALGTSGTVSVGDVASGTQYVNAAATLTAGTDATVASTMNTVGKIYTGGTSALRVTLSNSGGSITSGKIWLIFQALPMSAPSVVPVTTGAF